MKISNDHLDQLNIFRQKAQNTANSADHDFSSLLEGNKSKESADAAAQTSAQAATVLGGSQVVGMILASQKIGKTPDPVRQLESAFDQMEDYAAALGDQNKSLKDIAPLADGLKKTAAQLDELSRRLPETDPLKGLAGEAAVMATVESMKFSRGDYV